MNRIPKNNRQKKNQTQSLSSTFAQKVYKIYFLGYAYQKPGDFHTVFKTRVLKFQINTNSKNQLPKEKKKKKSVPEKFLSTHHLWLKTISHILKVQY